MKRIIRMNDGVIMGEHCNKTKEGILTGVCNHCGKFGKTNREQAMAWWNELSKSTQVDFVQYHLPGRPFKGDHFLSGSEIEEIWKNEIQG